jgi:hypothetical protein
VSASVLLSPLSNKRSGLLIVLEKGLAGGFDDSQLHVPAHELSLWFEVIITARTQD